MPGPIPILTPTHSGYETYMPALHALLGRVWPGHPPVWFVTDGKSLKMPRVVRVRSGNWILRLKAGVQALRKENPAQRHVFLLIDDLYPLRRCNVPAIERVLKASVRHGLACAYFLAEGETNCERPVSISGMRFYRIPRTFQWYSRIQPAVWEISHLLQLCDEALGRGFTDCWEFETLKSSGHYAADLRWPNVHDGLLHYGWVNLEAVKYMDPGLSAGFKERMLREYLRQQFSRRPGPALEHNAFRGLAGVFGALSHNARIRILKLLEMRPMTARELSMVTGMPLPSVRKHLRPLEKAKLVMPRQELPGAPYAGYPYLIPFCYHTLVSDIMKEWENCAPLTLRDRARAARIL